MADDRDYEPLYDSKIKVTLLDTETGQTALSNHQDCSPYWWAEGNGSCDCNRESAFDLPEDTWGDYYCCYGEKRFLVVSVEGDTGGYELWEFNRDYPEELLRKHVPEQYEAMMAVQAKPKGIVIVENGKIRPV